MNVEMLHLQIPNLGVTCFHIFQIFVQIRTLLSAKITVENYINYDLAEIGYIPTTSYIAK